jgi:anti-anti-sigma factor
MRPWHLKTHHSSRVKSNRGNSIPCSEKRARQFGFLIKGDIMATETHPALRVEVDKQAEITIVRCTGQVDVDSWPEFSATIRALIPEGKPIRVDLANVTRVDSTGIGAFVAVWTAAKRRNCDLKYRNPNEHVGDVIRITALVGMLEGREADERQLTTALGSQ